MIVALKGFNRVLIQFRCSVNSSSVLTHKKKKTLILSLFVHLKLFDPVWPAEAPASKMILRLTQTEELSVEMSVYIYMRWHRRGFRAQEAHKQLIEL